MVKLRKAENQWDVHVFVDKREITNISEIRITPSMLTLVIEEKEYVSPLNEVEFE